MSAEGWVGTEFGSRFELDTMSLATWAEGEDWHWCVSLPWHWKRSSGVEPSQRAAQLAAVQAARAVLEADIDALGAAK